MEEVEVVTCFLRNRSDVLLLCRCDEVGPYPGRWGAVAGHAEGDPDAAARREIAEETGLGDAVESVRRGDPFPVEDDERGTRWIVHPYLFDCAARGVEPNDETTVSEWVDPPELLHRETVPHLWESYRRVRPGVETVRDDRTHGSASLSVRALEVLRDRAAEIAAGVDHGDWDDLAALARELLAVRPGMAVVRNRVNRTMHAARDDRTAAAVERAARDGIERALVADERAAANAADRIDGTVLTLSRSGTVHRALRQASPDAVLVTESRPGGEGVAVAESLAADVPTTLVPDAVVAHALAARDVDAVLVGADTVLPDGRIVNKVGTRGAALAARQEGVPLLVVAAADKVSPDDDADLDSSDPAEVYDGPADLAVLAPTFDVTPADLVAELITERGVLDADGVRALADEHRSLADWEA